MMELRTFKYTREQILRMLQKDIEQRINLTGLKPLDARLSHVGAQIIFEEEKI